MNFKKILVTVIAALSVLSFAGMALAMPTSDINVWGASAQFNFWKAEAVNFLTSQGCTINGSQETTNLKNYIVNATCGGNSINFRVGSKASYDGILAIQGNSTNPNAYLCSGGTAFQRSMLNSIADNVTLSCQTVTIAAADVVAGDFKQISTGQDLGPYQGGAITRNFVLNPVTTTGVTDFCRPMAIPFSFFVNNSVKLSNGSNPTDISLVVAKIIFGSGLIYDWSDLVSYSALPINVCYRHAGSGTHATLNSLFPTLQTALTSGTSTSCPVASTTCYTGTNYFFNDGSADMMNCVNGSSTLVQNGYSWSGSGAIGYADSDQDLTDYPSTLALTLNGVAASRANLINWSYPFTTIQNMYITNANVGNSTLTALCTFASDPANSLDADPIWAPTCAFPFIPYSLYQPVIDNRANGNPWDYMIYSDCRE